MPTRTQLKTALTHTLEVVFGFVDADHSLRKALKDAGIHSLSDLLNMREVDIDALTYDDNGASKPVPLGHRNMIRIFQDYVRDCNNKGGTITDFMKVTAEDFDQFRLDPSYVPRQNTAKPILQQNPQVSPPPQSALNTFKKRIKRE